jgi:hypothetical protein
MSRMPFVVVAALLVASPLAVAQHPHPAGAPAKAAATDAQKIQNAMRAAPSSVSSKATIMDWPATPTGEPKELRKGTNGWVCYPNTPTTLGAADEDPMCLDGPWQSWAKAWLSKTPPPPMTGVGVAYMLKGDKGVSNTDPFAMTPTPDNQWIKSGPHIMVLPSDAKMLETYPTDPANGGPFVMWKGTPYAHLMVPVAAGTGPAATKPAMTKK